ncbi:MULTISPECIES: hypothetical protein [Paenibacillus]|uniref:Uncharacterized protein n=1 Tax=Paenibacillus polymyxa TaxID=1406 RepID=A0ABX2Z954_PAEPO|nr:MULTISPECIES: hypothetical protein [Paenibacillus]ODA07346.1 hypothetical protein A7312_09655 [Paenibacillus polymyxa]OME69635.1 hypothetical protein BK119_14280 [Paenibacillus peoriae]
MRKFRKFIKKTLMVLSIVLVGVVLYYSIEYLLKIVKTLAPQVLAAIIAGMFTVFVTVISLIIAKRRENKQSIDEQHRIKKIPIYEEFLQFWFKVLLHGKIGKPVTEEEMLNFFTEFTQKLILWGSDEVILEYGEFRTFFMKLSQAEGQNSKEATKSIQKFEKLITAIRKDVGHKNSGFKKNDILKLFITDIENLK